MKVTHTGNGVTSSTPIDGQVFSKLMVRATADAVITIGGNSINIDTDDGWVTIEAQDNSFGVTSGTVNYILLG